MLFVKIKQMLSDYYLNLLPVNSDVSEFYTDSKQHPSDSGLDMYFPEDVTIPAGAAGFMIGLGVACELYIEKSDWFLYLKTSGSEKYSKVYKPFLLIPRSSISKTPLRMSNSIGLIDANYRGELKVCVDNISDEDYVVEKGTRLFQIVNQMFNPMNIKLVETLSETTRGEGGFGSTGI